MIAAVLLATALTPGVVAMSLESPPEDRAAVLRAAMHDDDPHVRAAAARIINVSRSNDLLDDVRAAMAKETNAEAMREELRAIGMSGAMNELDALLAAAKSFGLENEAWAALAAANGPALLDEVIARREPDGVVLTHVLRGHPDLVYASEARLLGTNDPAMWGAALRFADDIQIPLDARLASAALTMSNREIAEKTTWYLAENVHDADRAAIGEALDRAVAATPNVSVSEAFARELLGRALGRKAQEREEWLKWLAATKTHRAMTFFTDSESKAAGLPPLFHPPAVARGTNAGPRTPSSNSAFTLLTALPAGVGDEVLAATGCNGQWLGMGAARIDRAGRVIEADLSNVVTDDSCRRALNVLFRASLATDIGFTAPSSATDVLLAHYGPAEHCFDEDDVVAKAPLGAFRPGGDVTSPRKIHEVSPVYPPGELASGIVIVRTILNRRGCVTAMKIVKGLTPALNTSAVLALSKWRFSPGLLNGQPVPVIYHLTINFKR